MAWFDLRDWVAQIPIDLIWLMCVHNTSPNRAALRAWCRCGWEHWATCLLPDQIIGLANLRKSDPAIVIGVEEKNQNIFNLYLKM